MVLKSLLRDRVILVIGFALGLIAGLIGLVVPGLNLSLVKESKTDPEYARIGASAPVFTLISLDGEKVALSDFSGKPVVLNFWATWCGPCRLEMPVFDAVQQKYGDQLVILAVNMQEDERDVNLFSNELDLDFRILLDPEGTVSSLYQIQGLPTTYFIDGVGKVYAIHIGTLTRKQLDGYLEKVGIGE